MQGELLRRTLRLVLFQQARGAVSASYNDRSLSTDQVLASLVYVVSLQEIADNQSDEATRLLQFPDRMLSQATARKQLTQVLSPVSKRGRGRPPGAKNSTSDEIALIVWRVMEMSLFERWRSSLRSDMRCYEMLAAALRDDKFGALSRSIRNELENAPVPRKLPGPAGLKKKHIGLRKERDAGKNPRVLGLVERRGWRYECFLIACGLGLRQQAIDTFGLVDQPECEDDILQELAAEASGRRVAIPETVPDDGENWWK